MGSESRFLTPHYQSVRPKNGQNQLVDTLHQWLIDEGVEKKPKEEEDDFIMQLNELPDPPCTPVRNLRSSFFTPPPFKCISLTLVLLLNVFSILLLPSLFPLLVKQ